MVPWNLVDNLSASMTLEGSRRAFYPPLASLPPGRDETPQVNPLQYGLIDEWDHVNRPTVLTFAINIASPPSGFADDAGLPDPALRLHAVAGGLLRYRPAEGEGGPSLELEMPQFLGAVAAPWWGRWVEAERFPNRLVYDHIDEGALNDILDALQPVNESVEGEAPQAPDHYGVRLPQEVSTPQEKDDFVAEFLAGNEVCFLDVSPGAVIGAAAVADPQLAGDPMATRLLRLRAYYWWPPGEDEPWPMNPRELLHLLFGDDSAEVSSHPLLQAIDDHGQSQPGLETRTMRLRPPLRTSARVLWEAQWEVDHDAARRADGQVARWAPLARSEVGETGPDGQGSRVGPRMFNSYQRDDPDVAGGVRTFNAGNYATHNKCNILVAEACLRAGFRVPLIPQQAPTFHYNNASSQTNLIHVASQGGDERAAVTGIGDDNDRIWAWGLDGWIRAQEPADREDAVNHAISVEGRCIVLAGARTGMGHIVLVEELRGEPMLTEAAGEGMTSCPAMIVEATGTANPGDDRPSPYRRPGAERRVRTFVLTGVAGGTGVPSERKVRIHLLEVHPGGDPDTAAGLQDLNLEGQILGAL